MPESHLPSLVAKYLRTNADLQIKQIPSGPKVAFYNA